MKCRKKPIDVEVVEICNENIGELVYLVSQNSDTLSLITEGEDKPKNIILMHVKTLEGTMIGNLGDFLIKGVNGEFCPCKPDVFAKTYVRICRDCGKTIPMDYTTDYCEDCYQWLT